MEPDSAINQPWEESVNQAKPFAISKWEVWEAYRRVRANKGAAGVDEQTIEDFEKNLKGNLYKIWNRMSSGSYFPPPVRTVKIPKANGGERKLGIPTVSDRIAQMVVKSRLEPMVDPLFHPDSYGYRPGKSALDAVGQARQRCWRYDWVVDLDIKGFFDNIPQDLFCFIDESGVEPTNNDAERALRRAVICRKISFGNRSDTGAIATGRLLTVAQTCAQQRRPTLAYLTEAVQRYRLNQKAPSLLRRGPETNYHR